jgi:hypothetical protein
VLPSAALIRSITEGLKLTKVSIINKKLLHSRITGVCYTSANISRLSFSLSGTVLYVKRKITPKFSLLKRPNDGNSCEANRSSVEKFPECYGPVRFITAFSSVLSLS